MQLLLIVLLSRHLSLSSLAGRLFSGWKVKLMPIYCPSHLPLLHIPVLNRLLTLLEALGVA